VASIGDTHRGDHRNRRVADTESAGSATRYTAGASHRPITKPFTAARGEAAGPERAKHSPGVDARELRFRRSSWLADGLLHAPPNTAAGYVHMPAGRCKRGRSNCRHSHCERVSANDTILRYATPTRRRSTPCRQAVDRAILLWTGYLLPQLCSECGLAVFEIKRSLALAAGFLDDERWA
jgi:hypothetical protein